MITTEQAIGVAKALTLHVREILPPCTVLSKCRALSQADSRLKRQVIGQTEGGREIESYKIGAGRDAVVWYAFPDPGEAVGGTSVVTLMEGLLGGDAFLASLDVTWHLVPCLNFNDQPDRGESLATVFRDPAVREVDWCTDNPRSETRALLEYARTIRPVFTYPLHDEFHCGKSVPLYFATAGTLPDTLCRHLVSGAAAFGLTVAQAKSDPSRPKVIDLASISDFPKSTFSPLAGYGRVLIAEVSQQDGVSAGKLVGAQLAFGLIALQHILHADDRIS